MSASELKVPVEVKMSWWFKAYVKMLAVLSRGGMINPSKAYDIAVGAVHRGIKYRVGNRGKWRLLKSHE